MKPLVSIIILNFNGLKDSLRCLTSISKTLYKNYEVIVVDNGSDNNESTIILKKFPKIKKIFRLPENLGFTGGNNWAVKKAKGEYIVLLNNDTTVDPNWITHLVDAMESDKKIAVAQPKIKLYQKKSYFDYAGAAGGYIDRYGFPFTRGRIFNTIEKDRGQYDIDCKIFWASGAACIIRKSVIKKAGGLFSENLFNYMEEIDFCWRVWRLGYKVFFIHKAAVYHKVASSSKKNFIQKRFWEHRNNLYILIRNLDRKNLLKILPVRMFLEAIAYVYYFVSRQRPYIKSLSLAHKDFVLNGFYIRLNRKRNLNHKKYPIYPGSIIYDHYIKKKKTFASLNWSAKGNIAYIIYSTEKNTGNTTVFKQANKFIDEGYSVQIYSIFGKSQKWFELKANLKNILNIYTDKKPDAVIATFWPTSYFLMIVPAKHKYYFSQDWGPSMHDFAIFKKLASLSYQLPIEHIVHSEFLKKKIKKVNKAAKIHKIRYCVLDNSFLKYFGKKKYRKTKKVNILSVITWYATTKGPDILEKAIINLKAKHKNYNFTLVSREDRPYSNVVDKFYSDPPKNKLLNIYTNSDVLLMTSRTEGMPIPGLEAMASGCLVVTTQSGGVMEYAKDNYNCIVVNRPSNIWEKDPINELFTNNKKVNKFVKNGYKTANNYWESDMITELEKIIFKE